MAFSYQTTMQSFTSDNCALMSTNQVITLTDTRNSQNYRVKKMADNKCWMIDNLKIVLAQTGKSFNPAAVQIGSNDYASNTRAEWVDPSSLTYCAGTTNMPAGSITKCGYFYNWCAVTGDTSANCSASLNITLGNLGHTPGQSICPASFRLPIGRAVGDFAYLNGMMGGDNTFSIASDVGHAANWIDSGAFEGVAGGYYAPGNLVGYPNPGFGGSGEGMFLMSATSFALTRVDFMIVYSTIVYVSFYDILYTSSEVVSGMKSHLGPIRCLLP
jgi:uncharacterized protein (TIGR02145 family)